MGSFPIDIDFRVDSKSLIKAFNDFSAAQKKIMADMVAGVAGADQKLLKLQEDFTKQMISTSTKGGRAVESSIRSLERMAEMAGKTRSEQLLIRQEKWIKSLGQDEAAVKRVTAAFQQLVKVEKEAEANRGGGHGGGGAMQTGTTANLIFRGTKDVFEGRTTYAAMDFITAAKRMQEGGGLLAGTTGALAGMGAAFAGVEVAAAHAAKSMGDYGEHLREIQGITGMTVVEIQKLEYVAKASGHTIEDVEKGMRGLTQALEGGGSKAVKVGKELKSMGVDVVGLRTGTISTYEALEQIGRSLEKNPDLWKTNIEMMDIFKKSGLNLKYLLKELASDSSISKMKFFTEDQVREMEAMDKRFDEIGAKSELFFKRIKFWMAQRFEADINLVIKVTDAAGKIWDMTGKHVMEGIDVERGWLISAGILPPEDKVPAGYEPETLEAERKVLAAQRKQRMDVRGEQFSQFLKGTGARGLEGAEQKLHDLEKEQKELREDTPKQLGEFAKDPAKYVAHEKQVTEELRKQKDLVEAMRQAESDRKAIAEAMRHARESVADRLRADLHELPAESELRKLTEMRGITTRQQGTFRDIYAPLIARERTEQADKLQRQMLETQQTVQRQMSRARMGGVEQADIRALGVGGVTRADVVSDIAEQEQQRRDIAMETFTKEMEMIKARKIDATDRVALAEQQRAIVTATGNLATSQIEAEMAKKKEMYALDKRERDMAREHRETMSKIELADQEEAIKHQADLQRKVAQLRFKGDNPAAGIAESYRIAVEEAQLLYDWEMKRIDLHETGYKAEEDAAIALHKLHRADEAAREEAQLKLAEMQQAQLDKLKSTIEPLYHTLFTNPRNFGAQLRSTVTEAALKPITSGLSELTATALHPLIYGKEGTGGIAGAMHGAFGGGRLNDVKLTPEGAVPVHIVGGMGGGGGTMPAGTSIYSMGGYRGGGGTFGIPGFGFPGAPGGTPGFAPGPIGFPSFPNVTMGPGVGGGTAYGGGMPSFDQLVGLPLSGGGMSATDILSGADMASLGGGGGFGGSPSFGQTGNSRGAGGGFNVGGLTGLLGGLAGGWKQMLGFEPKLGMSPGSESMARIGGKMPGGGFSLKGFSKSPAARGAAMAIGMPLAEAGLLGERRGTGLGVLEGTAGGAAIGFSYGGPIGAAIGAGVGFGIGMGEMLAGVESPMNEAKRLAKQLYRIDINSNAARQIVSIAEQSYGKSVSLAVRSPEVRHMLGLYAAGTGQGSIFATSANEAHGASLVESGGRLSQQATYQYGVAHVQSSNLPVYGGVQAATWGGGGGGPMNLSLNIGGQDAARFMTGQVVGPEVVSSQLASAMHSSSGRVSQSLLMSAPGAIAS